ncbi:uncharacterized [Tachysurus ichikawai]
MFDYGTCYNMRSGRKSETERRKGKYFHMEPCNDLRRVLARQCAIIDSSSAERECVGDTLVSDLYGNRFQVAFHNNRIWTAVALQAIRSFLKKLSSEESNHLTKSQNNQNRKQSESHIKLHLTSK